MSGTVAQLLLVAVLVLVNAAFAGTELALVSLRHGQLRRLEAQSRAGSTLARLARNPNQFLATIQIGITLAGFLASAAAAVSLAEPLQEPLGFLGAAAEPASIVVVTAILSYATLVLGELAPKRIAMQRAERWGLVAARPLAALAALTRPLVWLLSRSTDLVVRLFGSDPARHHEEMSADELRELVSTAVTFTPQQRHVIEGAFEVSERTLQEVLRPRPDVVVVASEARGHDALRSLASTGHSRAPVAPGANLDDVVGFVHIRDLLDAGDVPAGDLAREVPVYPESAHALSVLRDLQRRRVQLAVVVDEHGAGVGIVTVEDLIEEIVGEIYDEADPDLLAVRTGADGSMLVSGRFPVHDLGDIGVEGAPEGPYTTVAGMVLDALGRLPAAPGDVVRIADRAYEVTELRDRAISAVRIHPPSADPDERGLAPESGSGAGEGDR